MRVLTASLLAGVAAGAVAPRHQDQQQQVLGGVEEEAPVVEKEPSVLDKPLEQIKETWDSLDSTFESFLDGLSDKLPNAMPFVSTPKKHTRRPDSEWDHIVRGAEVQDIWVETDGEKHREVDGKIGSYDLRVKSVDPFELGVDPDVKQYSGYLDDNDKDKHLFYCTLLFPLGLNNHHFVLIKSLNRVF